jgi:hypothetical protein
LEDYNLDWVSWLALIIILCFASYPGKVRKLESKVRNIERKQKGENTMSKIIHELVDKTCKITTNGDSILDIESGSICTVLDVDDEWIKITYTDKKNNTKTQVLRIDCIDNIEIINN